MALTPTDVPSLNALGARLRATAADLIAAADAQIDPGGPACPRHLRGEAAVTMRSARVVAQIVDDAGSALIGYAVSVAGLESAEGLLAAEAERLGFRVTPDRVDSQPGPRAAADAAAEASRDAHLLRLNSHRLALRNERERVDQALRETLARHTAEAGGVADRLR